MLVINTTNGDSFKYQHLTGPNASNKSRCIWQASFANKLGCLAQGVEMQMSTGTDTIQIIKRQDVPSNKVSTYGRLVVSIWPNKTKSHRTCLTIGGNLIHYPENVSTPTVNMILAKILFNLVLSTPNARMVVADVKDFYLNTIMKVFK